MVSANSLTKTVGVTEVSLLMTRSTGRASIPGLAARFTMAYGLMANKTAKHYLKVRVVTPK